MLSSVEHEKGFITLGLFSLECPSVMLFVSFERYSAPWVPRLGYFLSTPSSDYSRARF